nr:helix-turn-helix transcriptional regulator [Curtobacterium sp. MCPF17_011]
MPCAEPEPATHRPVSPREGARRGGCTCCAADSSLRWSSGSAGPRTPRGCCSGSSASSPCPAVVHAPQRLQICAVSARGGEVEFGVLREALDVSDATLSEHLRILTDAGYVDLRRVQRAKGQARSWVSLTAMGSTVLREHFAFLQSFAPPEPANPRRA